LVEEKFRKSGGTSKSKTFKRSGAVGQAEKRKEKREIANLYANKKKINEGIVKRFGKSSILRGIAGKRGDVKLAKDKDDGERHLRHLKQRCGVFGWVPRTKKKEEHITSISGCQHTQKGRGLD